ncbi:MAG: retroviral-like aspartic protease family protein [Paramuribaculum sp.]|nr:retroviral-like aspartic protease family protein [Paramuribaculum sp.]
MHNKLTNGISSSLIIISLMMLMSACGKKASKPPYDLEQKSKSCISIPYDEMGGVKVIPVKINGITMNMIYDTGCSGVHISWNELQTLDKNGKIGPEDVLGVSYASIADGSIVANGLINIKRIEVGSNEESIVLENIPASVSLNQEAPILLGNSVLDELASVEVDNVKKNINFYKK